MVGGGFDIPDFPAVPESNPQLGGCKNQVVVCLDQRTVHV